MHGLCETDGIRHRLFQKTDKFFRLGGELAVFGNDPADADTGLAGQRDCHDPLAGDPLHQKAAAGGKGICPS